MTFLVACESRLEKQNNLEQASNTKNNLLLGAKSEDSQIIYQRAQDVFDARCVVCHACYDAPCQANFSSIEGIDRGANKKSVYGTRVVKAAPSRLGIDAEDTAAWRTQGFFPMLSEHPSAPLAQSLIYQLITQKSHHGIETNNQRLSEEITLGLNRKNYCPKIDEATKFAHKKPLEGMPFALPALKQEEQQAVFAWLVAGNPAPTLPTLSDSDQTSLQFWEQFFNQTSLKAQLVNRYLYEHLYLAHLYFDDKAEDTQFFQLVRSSTNYPEPIKIIATERPFNSPYAAHNAFYYRLKPIHQSIVHKTHMPYQLDARRHQLWQRLFFDTPYTVDHLPSYDVKQSSNPFISFTQIPVHSRYRFLLEEAQFTIMNFIKGPVCRGQVALDVINDHFWVGFVQPDTYLNNKTNDAFLSETAQLLRFPAYWGGQGSIFSWISLAKDSKQFMQKKIEHLNSEHQGKKLDLSYLWQGKDSLAPERINHNANLTVFRHFDSATVSQGFLGENPKTAWLIDYSLLERIHYLLVAGFDVTGTVQHQLTTRLYMEFLRMEGEANFINLMPQASQQETYRRWNTHPNKRIQKHFDILLEADTELERSYQSNDSLAQQTELLESMRTQVFDRSPLFTQLQEAANTHLDTAKWFAETALILVEDTPETSVFTLLRHSAHSSLSHLLSEKKTRQHNKDRLDILNGLQASYPNHIYNVNQAQLDDFLHDFKQVNSRESFLNFRLEWGIRRTHPDFWRISDAIHESLKSQLSLEYGILDFNRLHRD